MLRVLWIARFDTSHVMRLPLAPGPLPACSGVVSALREQGVHSVLLTGDNWRTARAIAAQLGIEEVAAEVMPAGKVAKIKVGGGAVWGAGAALLLLHPGSTTLLLGAHPFIPKPHALAAEPLPPVVAGAAAARRGRRGHGGRWRQRLTRAGAGRCVASLHACATAGSRRHWPWPCVRTPGVRPALYLCPPLQTWALRWAAAQMWRLKPPTMC